MTTQLQTRHRTTHEHLIITRFSVKFVADDDPFPARWLDDRLRLLEAYCLPGLVAQTCGDFKWLLLCDESTHPRCLDELTALSSEVPDSAVVLTSTARSSLPEILGRLEPPTDVLVTTRLDSDDAVAVDFVERIHAYAAPFRASRHEALLLNFSQGRTLDTEGAALYDSFQPQGPFLSLFERVGSGREPRTVYSGNHGRLYLQHPLHVDGSRPAWVQVVHGQNISNHIRASDLPVADDSPGEQFVIRPAAARRLWGVPAPHSDRIKATGEKGTEGVYPDQLVSGTSGSTG